jgi:ribonucleoside-diphosphate reductase alpha chain
VIHSSNLCTEITLNTGADETAVCNLGSVILDNHLTEDGNLDHEKLRETIQIAVRALDNVIDINFYPTEAARNANQRHRPVGLGVMGLQNALYKKGLSLCLEEAVEFNDEFMEAIAYYAYEASSDLAAERAATAATRAPSGTAACCPRTPSTCSKSERGEKIDVPRRQGWTGKPVREKIQKGCAIPTCWPSRRPPPSPTSWARRPASSRPTRTSSSRATSPGTSSSSTPTLFASSKAGTSGMMTCGTS